MNGCGAVHTHTVSGSSPVAVMKYIDKNNLRLILAHSSTYNPSLWGGQGSSRSKQLLTVGPQSECNECMHANILFAFSAICSPGFPAQEMVLPTIKMDPLTSNNIIKIISHR